MEIERVQRMGRVAQPIERRNGSPRTRPGPAQNGPGVGGGRRTFQDGDVRWNRGVKGWVQSSKHLDRNPFPGG